MEITYNRLPPSSAPTFNLNHSYDDNSNITSTTTTTTTTPIIQHMFEKPLTPSDVGKLNRLVIPKQHAENYFPLGQQKLGSVLSFEDIESRKLWHFRYSYWNSSQSYVLTKGWSQYVKEKRLHAGDVVLFQRHLSDSDRIFIGWRHRAAAAAAAVFVQDRMVAQPLPLPYQLPYCLHDAGEMYENVDTNYQRGVVATRRLRLFGVNLECQDDSEPSTPYGSSQGGRSDHQYNFNRFNDLHHEMKH